MVYKLSPSALKQMQECPRCFWLAKHKVWRRPSGPMATLPSGMDRILKHHFDKFMEKGKMPPELCEDKTCKGLKLFDNIELLNKWRVNFKGIVWEDKKGNILHGAVDNMLVKGKKLIVLDYKTRGFPLKEDTAKNSQLQLDVYNFLLRKNNYETEDYGLLLFYMPKEVTKTGEVIFDTELVKMDVDVKNAESVFNKALKLLNGDCPKDSCDWCEGR